MERERPKLTVLARIPNLKSGGSGSTHRSTLPNEEGRLISQTAAFRLLAATIVLLLVVAVIPLSASKTDPKAATPVADELPWQPGITSASRTAAEDAPQMSSWPNPSHSTSAQIEERREGVPPAANQPMAVRPTQYKADARTGF
jgi:hypothetical protein